MRPCVIHNTTKMSIRREKLHFEKLVQDIDQGRITLESNNSWCNTQRSKTVEAYLCGIPNPPIIIDATTENWRIIKGNLEIAAMVMFIKNKLRLSGLTLERQFNNCTFDDMNWLSKTRIKNRNIHAIFIMQGSPEVVKYVVDYYN